MKYAKIDGDENMLAVMWAAAGYIANARSRNTIVDYSPKDWREKMKTAAIAVNFICVGELRDYLPPDIKLSDEEILTTVFLLEKKKFCHVLPEKTPEQIKQMRELKITAVDGGEVPPMKDFKNEPGDRIIQFYDIAFREMFSEAFTGMKKNG